MAHGGSAAPRRPALACRSASERAVLYIYIPPAFSFAPPRLVLVYRRAFLVPRKRAHRRPFVFRIGCVCGCVNVCGARVCVCLASPVAPAVCAQGCACGRGGAATPPDRGRAKYRLQWQQQVVDRSLFRCLFGFAAHGGRCIGNGWVPSASIADPESCR